MSGMAVAASSPSVAFECAGLECVPDRSGALYIPAMKTLVVADLHLEKGSAFARRGVFLPPYDTGATLHRLAAAILHYAPRAVIALGDSFHDRQGPERLDARDREALLAMQRGRDWLWIAGNHDPERPEGCGGEAADLFRCGPLTLRHEPSDDSTAEIAGHLHPVARVRGHSGSVRSRCFVVDRRRCVMPAFGAFAGGLNLWNRAFDFFDRKALLAFALGRVGVHPIPHHACLPD